jgi:hypothetical protein
MHNNAGEVVRDVLRSAFCERQKLDLEDTPELSTL